MNGAMSAGTGAPEQTLGKKLAKASGEPAKQYPKVAAGKPLGWKQPNAASGKGVNKRG